MAARVTEGVTKISNKLHKRASSWFNRSSKRDKRGKHKAKRHAEFRDSDEGESARQAHMRKEGNNPEHRGTEKAKKDGKVPPRHIHQHHNKQHVHKPSKEAEDRAKHHAAQPEKPTTKAERKMQKRDGKVPNRHAFHHHAKPSIHKAEEHDRFHTKAKQHASHERDAAFKALKKLQKGFQKLFQKIASVHERKFLRMDREDVETWWKICRNWTSGSSTQGDLGEWPVWLGCQLKWWKMADRRQYMAEDDCWRYLAPGRMRF
nr:hypothetical protein BaRGS_010835 [Batillaria attramentaria]